MADPLADDLAAWLPSRRWFQGKARALDGVEVADRADVDGLRVVLADARFADGRVERYLVPLVPDEAGPLRTTGARWADAVDDDAAVRAMAALATSGGGVPTAAGGALEARPVTGQTPPADAQVSRLGAEQTNSSAVLDRRWILKVLRRLETGAHPDVEVTAALTARGFAHVPAQHGAWVHRGADGRETALAVLSDFLDGAQEGWALATAETRRLAAGGRPDPSLLDALDALGEVVAELHAHLDAAFGAEELTAAQAEAWAAEAVGQLDDVLATAAAHAPETTAAVREAAPALHAALRALATAPAGARLTRVHGDLHLGQVLRTTEGSWSVLDFEGEPVRPLAERRRPSSPLRDVAGMLRSFDYAAAAPTVGRGVAPAAEAWRDRARERFLGGYVAGGGALPDGARPLLTALELDKAVYELGYELANRPAWAAIPADGILRVLGEAEEGPS